MATSLDTPGSLQIRLGGRLCQRDKEQPQHLDDAAANDGGPHHGGALHVVYQSQRWGWMQAGSGPPAKGEPPAVAAPSVPTATSDVAAHHRRTEQQAGVLLALHNDLLQHQQSVHQAFTALDQACCTLAASLVTQTTPSTHAAARVTREGATEASTASSSCLHGFTALLRDVEVLHHFLFTNLYVHQRECTLQLVRGVERAVLGAADAAASLTAGDVGGREELRVQAAQLRHQLLHGPQALLDDRAPRTSTGGTQAHILAAQGITAHEDVSTGVVPVADATTIATAASASAAPLRGVWSEAQRLFALSAAFAASGEDGLVRLHVVLRAAQRRFRIHAVVLDRATPSAGGGAAAAAVPWFDAAAAAAEVQLARRYRCLCLVVPAGARHLYPATPPIFVATDDDVLTQPPPPPPRGESDSEGEEGDLVFAESERPGGRAAALEALFHTLEADLPDYGADALPWSPTSTVASGEAEVTAVQRAALKRSGRLSAPHTKRPRTDSGSAAGAAVATGGPPPAPSTSSSTSSGTAIAVSVTPSVDRLPETFTSTPESQSGPTREHGLLGSLPPLESQHIGYTQHGLPVLSAAPSSTAAAAAASRLSPSPPTGITTTSATDTTTTTATADAPIPAAAAPPVFQISNSVKYLKPQLMEAITELGGIVDIGSGYSRSCRFLVAAEGITERTEKYLGACAAAAHIVPPRYVFDSQRRGYWLSNRVHEYDMSPQRCPPHLPRPPPIFRSWRVVLITCRSAAARGVRAALLAGGCTRATAFVVDLTADVPFSAGGHAPEVGEAAAVEGVVEGVCPTSVIAAATLNAATHILVECSSVTAQGCFQLPDWVPLCVRQPRYASRIFTLELLYFCLCAHPERVFDGEGLLCDGDALTPACRVEPLGMP